MDVEKNIWRVGLLVVHGMGQQQRHQQLAEVAAPLCDQLAPGTVPKVKYFTHRGHTEKRVVMNLPADKAPEGFAEVEISIIELYWAHLVRSGTNLLQVLLWMGWAVYRELLPNEQPADGAGCAVRGSPWRAFWLGLIILGIFTLVCLTCLGMLWFAWESGVRLICDLHTISNQGVPRSAFCQDLINNGGTCFTNSWQWVVHQWVPFLLFSVSIRAAYILLTQAVPPVRRDAPRTLRPDDSGTSAATPDTAQSPPASSASLPEPETLPKGQVVRQPSAPAARCAHPVQSALHGWLTSVPVLLLAGSAFFGLYPGSRLPWAGGFDQPWFVAFIAMALAIYLLPARLRNSAGNLLRLKEWSWPGWLWKWRSVVGLLLLLPCLVSWLTAALDGLTIPTWLPAWLYRDWMLDLLKYLAAAPDVTPRYSTLALLIVLGVLVFSAVCLYAAWRRAGHFGWQEGILAASAILSLLAAAHCLFVAGGMASALTCFTLLLVVYALIRLLIVDYFGDIAIFITQSETSAHFHLRRLVLDEALCKLEYLFGYKLDHGENKVTLEAGNPRFDRVGVIAHSLGCPVTYDAICRYFNALRARERLSQDKQAASQQLWVGPAAPLPYADSRGRFAFYATCGCILEIVKFYFARRAGSVELFEQLEQHGKLTNSSDPSIDRNPGLHFPSDAWINIRSLMDPFTWPGLRTFGRGIHTHLIPSLTDPVAAHVQYFTNAHVKALLTDALRFHCEVDAANRDPNYRCDGGEDAASRP